MTTRIEQGAVACEKCLLNVTYRVEIDEALLALSADPEAFVDREVDATAEAALVAHHEKDCPRWPK